jgi:hypothetical protein
MKDLIAEEEEAGRLEDERAAARAAADKEKRFKKKERKKVGILGAMALRVLLCRCVDSCVHLVGLIAFERKNLCGVSWTYTQAAEASTPPCYQVVPCINLGCLAGISPWNLMQWRSFVLCCVLWFRPRRRLTR